MLTVMGSHGNRALQNQESENSVMLHDDNSSSSEHSRLVEALSELHNLLEEYSPSWYTEEHRNKAQTALHPRKKH